MNEPLKEILEIIQKEYGDRKIELDSRLRHFIFKNYFKGKKLDEKALEALVILFKPDYKAIESYNTTLKPDNTVREIVAKILVSTSIDSDPFLEMRDQKIIDILMEYGINENNSLRDFCLDSFHAHVPSDILIKYSQTLIRNFQNLQPSSEMLNIIAKAKFKELLPIVNSLMKDPYWSKQEQTLIALAALGNLKIENKFIDKFINTKDPKEKMNLAHTLGYIGTKSALKALVSEMRTDLVYEMPHAFRKSVRVEIIEALSFNYPDKTFLWDNAILDDEGYVLVEKFCEEDFGIKWTKPRPSFLWIEGYPSER